MGTTTSAPDDGDMDVEEQAETEEKSEDLPSLEKYFQFAKHAYVPAHVFTICGKTPNVMFPAYSHSTSHLSWEVNVTIEWLRVYR